MYRHENKHRPSVRHGVAQAVDAPVQKEDRGCHNQLRGREAEEEVELVRCLDEVCFVGDVLAVEGQTVISLEPENLTDKEVGHR